MPSNTNAKTNQLNHSKAKVDLYTEYLAIYLNILGRASNIRKVHIFDLMCGEGIYADGSKGSAITALHKIRDFVYANPMLKVSIEIWLNDSKMSLIEKDRKKIERVHEESDKISLPPNVKVEFFDKDFSDILPEVVEIVQSLKQARAFVFIDPHGYKNVKPQHIKSLLKGGKSEVLLFLPATFLYRFADKSFDPSFLAGEPLYQFISELFPEKIPFFLSAEDFIKDVKSQFREFLSDQQIFVDTFTIQRDATNLYCLYFFTSSVKGFQKMLQVKWKLDSQRGKGFRIEKTGDLFPDIEVNQYPQRLLDYLKSKEYRTNKELFLFGLHNGYLPTHTNDALDLLKQQGHRFDISSLDNIPLKRKAFYLDNDKRNISIKLSN